MHSMHYQRWTPPLSPVRIEFPNQLLREIALGSSNSSKEETRGSLYGLLLGGEIRVLAARNEGDGLTLRQKKRDPQLAGTEKIGIFVHRVHGEVFLSETDLERFEGQRAAVALVIAGNRAGFFVRQADGSIQTIRSHEEFSLADASPIEVTLAETDAVLEDEPLVEPLVKPSHRVTKKPHAEPSSAPSTVPARGESKTPGWPRAAMACLVIPLAGLAYFRSAPPVPVQLHLQPAGETVVIAWNPAATTHGGALEIEDGAAGAKLELRPSQSSLSYTPHNRRLEVRITADNGDGPAQLESVAWNVEAPSPAAPGPEASRIRAQIASLDAEAAEVRESLDRGGERISSLQKTIGKLTHR